MELSPSGVHRLFIAAGKCCEKENVGSRCGSPLPLPAAQRVATVQWQSAGVDLGSNGRYSRLQGEAPFFFCALLVRLLQRVGRLVQWPMR